MSDFKDEILVDIGERKELLSNLKTIPFRYNFDEKDKQIFLNYAVLSIYAVLEGFIQQSFQIYVAELNRLQINRNDICDSVMIFTIENKFKQTKEYPEKDSKKLSYFNNLDEFFKNEKIEIPMIINTESNVGLKVINRLLSNFNLALLPEFLRPKYSLKNELRFFINESRNPIAHGNIGGIIVSQENIDRFILLVEIIMQEIFDRISEGYTNKTYLKEY